MSKSIYLNHYHNIDQERYVDMIISIKIIIKNIQDKYNMLTIVDIHNVYNIDA